VLGGKLTATNSTASVHKALSRKDYELLLVKSIGIAIITNMRITGGKLAYHFAAPPHASILYGKGAVLPETALSHKFILHYNY
jgi:hypothetical protein